MADSIARGHVIREIFLGWVDESGGEVTPEDETVEIRRLAGMSDIALEHEWAATVGEYAWACGHEPDPQWHKVSAGEPTDYTFSATVDDGFVARYAERVTRPSCPACDAETVYRLDLSVIAVPVQSIDEAGVACDPSQKKDWEGGEDLDLLDWPTIYGCVECGWKGEEIQAAPWAHDL